MKYLNLVIVSFFSVFGFSQNPTISWQKTTGGGQVDNGVSVIQELNGDLVVCSSSASNQSGEKSEDSFGSEDIWVYKIAVDGTILWQNTIGGSELDRPSAMVKTNDGGFIIVGLSKSPVSGNKTAVHYGDFDVWVIRLASNGQILWQKSYGGSGLDVGLDLILMGDGSFYISASSSSGIEGNKSIPSKGGSDYWLIHCNTDGTILNQYVFGGSDNEYVRASVLLSSNKLILSGSSYSNASGDKQEDSYGESDYWTIISDTNGNILKSITIGGDDFESNPDIQVDSDGSILLFGYSRSGISGNKSSSNYGSEDFWVVKLDSNLLIKWDKTFGGTENESNVLRSSVIYSATHSVIIGGGSNSNISGNKTLPSFGAGDIWIVGMDTLGIKEFEFVAGGMGNDGCSAIIESLNSTIYVVGGSGSGISGNKTETSRGGIDVWMFELDFNVGIEKVYFNNELKAYPVPAATVLNFAIPLKGVESQISLINISGQVVYSDVNANGENEQIDVSNYPSGIYVLSVISDKFQYTRKIVIE